MQADDTRVAGGKANEGVFFCEGGMEFVIALEMTLVEHFDRVLLIPTASWSSDSFGPGPGVQSPYSRFCPTLSFPRCATPTDLTHFAIPYMYRRSLTAPRLCTQRKRKIPTPGYIPFRRWSYGHEDALRKYCI